MRELQENDYASDIFLDLVETGQNVRDWKVNMDIYGKTANMKLIPMHSAIYCHIMSINRLGTSLLKHHNQD